MGLRIQKGLTVLVLSGCAFVLFVCGISASQFTLLMKDNLVNVCAELSLPGVKAKIFEWEIKTISTDPSPIEGRRRQPINNGQV